jgi:hypothetical protein
LENLLFPLGHEYEGLAAVHEEEVTPKKNLARQCHKVRKSQFPLEHEYKGLAAVHEEEVAAEENLARQCHKVRNSTRVRVQGSGGSARGGWRLV